MNITDFNIFFFVVLFIEAFVQGQRSYSFRLTAMSLILNVMLICIYVMFTSTFFVCLQKAALEVNIHTLYL